MNYGNNAIIWIIIIWLIVGNGGNSCFSNLLGCGNNNGCDSTLWILIIILFLCGNNCGVCDNSCGC